MSGCDVERIESFAEGELDAWASAEVSAHLTHCAACAEELALLREERALFAARAAAQPAPPSFAEVLARASRAVGPAARSRPPKRLPLVTLGVAAAAALVALVLLPGDHQRPSPAEGAVEIHAEPLACFDDEARVSLSPAAAWTVGPPTNVPPCDQMDHPVDDPARGEERCDGAEELPACGSSEGDAVTNTCAWPREGEGERTP